MDTNANSMQYIGTTQDIKWEQNTTLSEQFQNPIENS